MVTQNKTVFTFEKVILKTMMCLGTCPVYHLEINSDKQFKLLVEEFCIEESFEKEYVKQVQYKINRRPRKNLNFKSSKQVFF